MDSARLGLFGTSHPLILYGTTMVSPLLDPKLVPLVTRLFANGSDEGEMMRDSVEAGNVIQSLYEEVLILRKQVLDLTEK